MARHSMRPLERLRLRLTGWYVVTITATLVALGAGLFVAVTAQIGTKLDRSLREATDALAAEVRERQAAETPLPDGEGPTALQLARETLGEVHIPDRLLYLSDAAGRPLAPDTASRWVLDLARRAAAHGAASTEIAIGNEHRLRIYAKRFDYQPGRTMIALAASDTEELEDEYASLIALFVGTLVAALLLVGAGGYFLAGKSSAPIERSFEHMRRFMSDAAHELRTPIAIVRTQLDVALQQPRAAAEYVVLLRELSIETARLSAIVDDVFTLARAEAAEQRIERERIYLDDIILQAVERTRALAAQHGVRVEVVHYDEAPILGQARLIEQLAVILIDNAIKYSPAGAHVTVGVRLHRPPGALEARAVLTVSDEGIGIPESERGRVFDRFYRSPEARKRSDGAGLGLPIAHWIAEAHEATISLGASPRGGTLVSVSFALEALAGT